MASPMPSKPVEADLLLPLLGWLSARRQIRENSILVEEFPWHGRRVDLAVLTASGRTAAFELKLAHNRRALEQSYLNGVSFDRSYLVTATRPAPSNLQQAANFGLGIIYVSPAHNDVSLVVPSRAAKIHPQVRQKLRRALTSRGDPDV